MNRRHVLRCLGAVILAAPIAELLREIVPRAERIAVLANRSNPVAVPILRATESAAQQIRMKLRVLDVRKPADVAVVFETMGREQTDAFVLVADPLLFSERVAIVQPAARHRLPAVYETSLFPEVGGLLSYGPLPQERFQRMAVYVDRILRGARPAATCRSNARPPSSSWSTSRPPERLA